MSLLAPLYVLGALAIAAPIVFHLIRRSPRGEVPFSSLMFLSPTPPRLTRRSRLDDWLLLLLRAAALLLLALAFARPFLREALALDSGDGERRRVAVLVDTSASLRRGDLWERARAAADEAIAACRPGDEIALFAFDDATRPLFTFAESATLDADRRQAVARARLRDVAPSWGGTDLGQALVEAVGAVDEVADASEKAGRMPRRIVLVTDLQQGSRVEALGSFEWPSDVQLEIKTVADGGSNAVMQRLEQSSTEAAGAEGDVRVRVSNDAGSRKERFRLVWASAAGTDAGKAIDLYVPPGESRVATVQRAAGATALRLEGDDHAFDNTVFVADAPRQEVTVVYVGDDEADDPAGLLYFLERVFPETPRRTVRVRRSKPVEALELNAEEVVTLVVVSSALPAESVERVKRFAEAGGTVLCVLRSSEQSATLAALAGAAAPAIEEASVDGDVMLGEIDFGHALFAPFVGPQFNDFTKVRFWKYRRVDTASIGDVRVAARFENDDPAVFEKGLGKGRLVVMTSGWNIADSQLARSSKFVPLMATLLDRGGAERFEQAAFHVNDPVPVPTSEGTAGRSVRKPDGATARLDATADEFAGTDQPGIYEVDLPGGSRSFAVNLDPAEGKTSPLPVETLEQLGCRLVGGEEAPPSEEERRQMLGAELEGRQKLWRWLILAAAGVLIAETWLAGRLGRPRGAGAEVAAT